MIILQTPSEYARGDLKQEMSALPGEQMSLTHSVNRIRTNVGHLTKDIDALTRAAVSGQLKVRADASTHLGALGKVIEGINSTLDAATDPVQEAASVLIRLAKRELDVRVTGDYHGDNPAMKDAVNSTAAALNEAMQKINGLTGKVE